MRCKMRKVKVQQPAKPLQFHGPSVLSDRAAKQTPRRPAGLCFYCIFMSRTTPTWVASACRLIKYSIMVTVKYFHLTSSVTFRFDVSAKNPHLNIHTARRHILQIIGKLRLNTRLLSRMVLLCLNKMFQIQTRPF